MNTARVTAGYPGVSRRAFLGAAAAFTAPLGALAAPPDKKAAPRKNVLFITVDDLRTDLGCYGESGVKTPNIDRLSDSGLTFLRSYCQQAVCNPSRTSMLTGKRPDTTRIYDLQTHFRRYLPDAVTLPEQFRRSGYTTTAFGKIFHKPQLNDYPSWSIAPWIADRHGWRTPENEAFAKRNWDRLQANAWVSDERFYFDPLKRGPRQEGVSGWGLKSWRSPDVDDAELPDGKTALEAASALKQLKDQPFFMAVGFLRPHLPFVAPKKYFDWYPESAIEQSAAPLPPEGAPTYALHDSAELRGYDDIPLQGAVPSTKAKELIRAYRASVSYIDAQVGILLDALEVNGLADNTVVVLWGDHGYHLGDLGLWNKHSNFEAATHTPLIVRAPGLRNAGRKTQALNEAVDICPSLCDICNVPRPSNLEGSSWLPLFENPDQIWKRAAFSQYPREIPGVGPGMGYSMRTSRYRYTEWSAIDSPYKAAELYDYRDDVNELRNLANLPRHVSLVNGLSQMLREGWRASLPPTELPYSMRSRV